MSAEKPYYRKMWGGFESGRLDFHLADHGWGGFGCEKIMSPAVYRSRDQARKHYEDVRPIEIREIGKTDESDPVPLKEAVTR